MESKVVGLAALIAAGLGSVWWCGDVQTQESHERGQADAVERARREVRMLDDIYKGGIVTITKHYVNDEDTIPAGTAFKSLFEAAEKKGWHRVRLLDATGTPYNDENVAEDDFERRAIKALVQGKSWVESMETRKGTRHLRVATPIPVVSEKCTMCHDHYADVSSGTAIGALTYLVPVDGPLVTSATKEGANDVPANRKASSGTSGDQSTDR